MEHFRDEEKLMRDAGYSGLEEHIKEHQRFIAQIGDYKEAVCGSYVPFHDMLDFLKKWFVKHITVSDQKYMEFILTK